MKPWSLLRSIESWLVLRGGAKFLFWLSWVLFHLLVFGLGFVSYQLSDNRVNTRSLFGTTYALSGATSLVLHIDVIFILFPVCRNLISFLRSRMSGLNTIIPFDQAVTFHEATGWSMIFFSLIHIVFHEINFMKLVLRDPLITNRDGHTTTSRLGAFFALNFATGPGLTGWLMVLFLGIMTGYAMKRMRKRRYERFWYSHHLFVLVFALWQLHGMFCLIKPDREPYCSWKNVGVFWRFWTAGGTIWIIERILREIITYITKVILHPSGVVELRIKKQKTRYLGAGQHIYISCPEISYFQWHPFMITSSPEEDYLSVNVAVRGNWTDALAKAVGCEFDVDVLPVVRCLPPRRHFSRPRSDSTRRINDHFEFGPFLYYLRRWSAFCEYTV
ncbi:hypothetical protein K435DRAFT_758547 [Dendrothele bispora CBS 962.96]|uniref:FAD-binding FR-type domain-containing protein n=1 Tax=Dendrothele bispora (strain CBS 962.96) TaxID=1314807 RepID=A0A4S8LSP0_DENBC|nr:hypothetical protein K435DRAFT_758547 [Dendrothele bispora CBS 962.96]